MMLFCGNRIRQGIPRHGEIAIEFTELFRWQEKGDENEIHFKFQFERRERRKRKK